MGASRLNKTAGGILSSSTRRDAVGSVSYGICRRRFPEEEDGTIRRCHLSMPQPLPFPTPHPALRATFPSRGRLLGVPPYPVTFPSSDSNGFLFGCTGTFCSADHSTLKAAPHRILTGAFSSKAALHRRSLITNTKSKKNGTRRYRSRFP